MQLPCAALSLPLKQTPIKKTDEELMIEEICREATTSQQMQQIHTAQLESVSAALPVCSLVTNNLPWLMLQPLQVELLSLDPFIVIYHGTLSGNQLEELKEFVVDKEDTETVDDSLQLTKIGLKKMRQINEKLFTATGHGREALDARDWHLNRYNFENIMEVDRTPVQQAKAQAGVLFNVSCNSSENISSFF